LRVGPEARRSRCETKSIIGKILWEAIDTLFHSGRNKTNETEISAPLSITFRYDFALKSNLALFCHEIQTWENTNAFV